MTMTMLSVQALLLPGRSYVCVNMLKGNDDKSCLLKLIYTHCLGTASLKGNNQLSQYQTL